MQSAFLQASVNKQCLIVFLEFIKQLNDQHIFYIKKLQVF